MPSGKRGGEEEVACQDRLGLDPQEPQDSGRLCRAGPMPLAVRISQTAGAATLMPRPGHLAVDPPVSPAGVLAGQLRRENRRRDARAGLRTAHDLFTTMGTEAFAERARRELLATGDTVRKRTVETVSELTAREAHIARLAVNGLTNTEIGAQLFLSTRTVEWHLSKVYVKLGVGSRRELRRALASLGQAALQT